MLIPNTEDYYYLFCISLQSFYILFIIRQERLMNIPDYEYFDYEDEEEVSKKDHP